MTTNKALLSERIQKLVGALSSGVYERESTIRLCLLAALAGESVFLLGPPGIAKSYIAKRLIKAFDQASFFEYLMTRFSTPEEVFGPLSIQELKDNGKYVRLTDGYLPEADVVFLDEIWKAGPAILNTLLTVINERTFKNGSEVHNVPMRLLITASNELPEPESGLDALYDRMLVRIFLTRIQEKDNFRMMLMDEKGQDHFEVDPSLAIKEHEYFRWQRELSQVTLSDTVFDKLYALKQAIESAAAKQGNSTVVDELYISDRRWKKALNLLKASAFFSGRSEVNPLDLLLLQECLWHSPDSRQIVRDIMAQFAAESAFDQTAATTMADEALEELNDLSSEIADCLHHDVSNEAALRGERYRIDLTKARRYKVNSNSNMVKLVVLASNPSVSERESGDSRWVFVDAVELEKQAKSGHFEILGYVNKNTHLCMLKFDVDAGQRLIIRDIANRAVPVGIAGIDDATESEWSVWLEKVQGCEKKFSDAHFLSRRARSQINMALPHHFADPELVSVMANSLADTEEKLDVTEVSLTKIASRLKRLPVFFDDGEG
ncbi:AAA family ATPase [Parasalinivibrio latis]|uniref:AAA family ATPase n=1 Tax=Parasalinivibrio latis TaxID=2952610 RepID=UPI0030E163FE